MRHVGGMPKNPPESMQRSLRQRLNEHAAARWPALAGIDVRYRSGFAYVDGRLPDGDVLKRADSVSPDACTLGLRGLAGQP